MKRLTACIIIGMLLTTVACSFSVNVPEINIKTGPTQTFTIDEALPSTNGIQMVDIAMGAGSLTLGGGANGLAEGTVRYNIAAWKPTVTKDNGSLQIRQERTQNITIPREAVNEWIINLSDQVDLDLSIAAGAYKGIMNLGGLRIHSLSITDGASDSEVTFDQPNPVSMDTLEYKTGASQVKLSGLANANFKNLVFESGAGNYQLDFSGELKANANVTIKSGVSQITIIVPAGMSATVTNSGALTNVQTEGNWTVNGSTYSTQGSGSQLIVDVTGGVGNINLIQK